MPEENSNIIWALRAPLEDDVFANAAWHGTWTKGQTCKECGKSTSKRVGPLVIEWQNGSDVVGDFTWLGFGMEVIIQDRVRRIIEDKFHFRDLQCLPVEMVEAPWRQRAKAKTKTSRRRTKIVELPYKGPPLWEMHPAAIVPLDRSRSKFHYTRCNMCGSEGFEAVNPKDRTEIVVAAPDIEDIEIFRIKEASVFIACKDVVKRAIEKEGLTNIRFTEWGTILPGERNMTWTPPVVSPSSTSSPAEHENRPRESVPEPAPLTLFDGRIVRFGDLPDEIDELKDWSIQFPELPIDQRNRYREFMEKLLDYLRTESGYDDLGDDDLIFVRSALVGDHRYWIWSFEETTGPSYATVHEGPGGGGSGYNEGFGLTPEQFILADYFGML